MKYTRRSIFAATAGALAATPARANFASSAERRRAQALQLRFDAARAEGQQPLPDHTSNGDETTYANRIGSFSKGLPHNNLGEVNLNAYTTLLNALESDSA